MKTHDKACKLDLCWLCLHVICYWTFDGIETLDSVCFKYGAIHFAGSSPLGTWHVGFTTARYSTPFLTRRRQLSLETGSVVKDMEWLGLLPRVRQLKVMDADVIFFKFWCGMKRKSMEIHKYKQTRKWKNIPMSSEKVTDFCESVLIWSAKFAADLPSLATKPVVLVEINIFPCLCAKQILQASGPYLTSSINQVLKLYSYRPSLIWIQDAFQHDMLLHQCSNPNAPKWAASSWQFSSWSKCHWSWLSLLQLHMTCLVSTVTSSQHVE